MQFNDQVIYFTIDFFHWYGSFQKYCKTLIFSQHYFMDKEMATGKVKWLAQSRMAGKWQTRTRVCDWTSSINFSVLLPTTTFTVLLLLLSHFRHVRLCVTPSLGFSRQEHWSGLPFPSPMQKSEKWKWSRSVLSDSLRPHGLQPTRLLHPWDFPGKSTGVGCHCLLCLQH